MMGSILIRPFCCVFEFDELLCEFMVDVRIGLVVLCNDVFVMLICV